MKKDRKIQRLDLVFENCDVYSLNAEMIVICIIDKIYNNIGINCFQYENGEVFDSIHCEEFCIVINQKGLQVKGRLDEDILEKRLEFKDITHIDIIYNDGTNEYITMPWDDIKSEYTNALQHNYYCNFWYTEGECIVVIIQKEPLTLEELEEKYGIETIRTNDI